ncbi:MAG: neutral/alkaline non-lysosomal ceramidase N-terminal domain-containing protein, partial [Planctomycetaceae bacterium]|nr:neutral/alkaline non-lysosomal ceramidase N-terminal domain-containing protein [Planctomycetaceae bacterium]
MTDRIEFPQSRCIAGVARGDVTPPVGIYHRMWGAAAHDRATGVHRPLTFTILILAPDRAEDVRSEALVFIALDHCLMAAPDLNDILGRVATENEIPMERIIVYFSHTHAAGLMGRERFSLPGGDLIPGYFAAMSEKLSGGVQDAITSAEPATILYGAGPCALATNRDYFDRTAGHFVCGFNPGGPADSTVLVARVQSRADNRPLATVVNYACHPTTLAWDNTLISPDYIGAMREVVEEATRAPCFFIQGASGDIGPREGFVGSTDVADRNGRIL